MKRILAVVMLCVFGIQVFACSVPDDPNWDIVVSAIHRAPPDMIQVVRNYETAEDIYQWIRKDFAVTGELDSNFQHWDENFFEITCSGDDEHGPVTYGYTVHDLIGCLNYTVGSLIGPRPPGVPLHIGQVNTKRSFDDCVKAFTNDADGLYQRSTGAEDRDIKCKPKLAKVFQDAPVEEWTDSYDDEGLARKLIESKEPPIWIQLIGIVFGTIVDSAPTILVALCALGTGWSCPSSPLYPPGQTPQPGGDR